MLELVGQMSRPLSTTEERFNALVFTTPLLGNVR